MASTSLTFRANVAGSGAGSLQMAAAGRQQMAAPAARGLPLQVESRVAIRFTRGGRRKSPFYRIIAIDSRDRREGRPLEFLGYYNPMTKETSLNAPAIKKWIGHGAQPSQTVGNLLKKAMIVE
mmetsp:Transcript_43565/g.111386  ORF Transcript_43565/g.111386 Transcript_43565/m.111386 type:complete len:123 (+) Transcript_43565:115-483(+)|eukprot:jgi/Tetstr1/459117/TSEL_004566.t1